MQRLIQASLEGNTARLTALVDGSLNPRELVNRGNELGMSALHIAVMMGAADCARKLLDAGADPKARSTEGATPIVMAAQGAGPGAPGERQEGGAAKCIQYLLDAGVDQTERDEVVGTVPLHKALYSGRLGVFKALLAGPGGEVAANTKDSLGATPLHIACREKRATRGAAAMALLGESCPVMVDVNVRDDEGRTPLYDATHHGHAGVVKLLMAAGCDPSLGDSTGMTPLSAAAWLGEEACLDMILQTESGLMTVEMANNLGATPLIFACQEDHKGIAEKLIAAGASLDARDVMGKTPYLVAKTHNASACLELLREEHGRPTPEEANFDVARPAVAVALKGGVIEVHGDGGVAFSVKEEKEEEDGAGDGAGDEAAAGPAPLS